MSSFIDRAVRIAATSAHGLLKGFWLIRRPKTFGAHAVALTAQNRLILVKLRYASGWRLPGGGRSREEPPMDAALRELREEIGMVSHGDVSFARELEEASDFKRDTAAIVIVRDVQYRPRRWSWEVEQVSEADPRALPPDLSPRTARWLEAIAPHL